MAANKKARKVRTAGEPLPKMVDSARVLRALKGTMTEKQFIKAYDEAAAPRGAGLKTPPRKLQNAFKKFQRDGDFDAFAETMGLDSQRAIAALGRMMRWEAAGR